MGHICNVVLLHDLQFLLFADAGDDEPGADPVEHGKIDRIASQGLGDGDDLADIKCGAHHAAVLYDRNTGYAHQPVYNRVGMVFEHELEYFFSRKDVWQDVLQRHMDRLLCSGK